MSSGDEGNNNDDPGYKVHVHTPAPGTERDILCNEYIRNPAWLLTVLRDLAPAVLMASRSPLPLLNTSGLLQTVYRSFPGETGFSDRDWAFIRKSMTDLTEKEQDRMIVEMKKILDPTSSLSPDEPANVSLRSGYYILNATEGGKPVNSSDLPGLPKEKSAQTSASIPLTIPLIAMGGFGIFRHLLLGNNKK